MSEKINVEYNMNAMLQSRTFCKILFADTFAYRPRPISCLGKCMLIYH